MMLGFFFKCNSCWLANGFKLVNKQRQKLTNLYFSHFMITGVIGFGGHSIVGNIEVLELLHKHNYTFRLPKVSVFSHSGNAIGGAVVGTFKYRIFESNNMK
jgi:hypothetical protein